MAAMTRHMLTQTVPKEVADLARYYTRGMEIGEDEAAPRRDMHPLVAKGLGVDPDKPRQHRPDQRAARRSAGRR